MEIQSVTMWNTNRFALHVPDQDLLVLEVDIADRELVGERHCGYALRACESMLGRVRMNQKKVRRLSVCLSVCLWQRVVVVLLFGAEQYPAHRPSRRQATFSPSHRALAVLGFTTVGLHLLHSDPYAGDTGHCGSSFKYDDGTGVMSGDGREGNSEMTEPSPSMASMAHACATESSI